MRRALEWLGGSCLVYAALAACSGGGGAIAPGPDTGMIASSGQPSSGGVAAGGKEGVSAGSGGLLDPVPPAMAAGGGGSSAGPAPITYASKVVACSSKIKVGATDFPAASLAIDPPSVPAAIATMHTVPYPSAADGWLQGSPGGLVTPDGSQVAVICTSASEMVTFYVPG
jgi:hypothetical protein